MRKYLYLLRYYFCIATRIRPLFLLKKHTEIGEVSRNLVISPNKRKMLYLCPIIQERT